jgi:tetratricopeptide (TPR) repeat protein
MSEAIEAGRRALAIAADVEDADLTATTNFFLGTVHQTRGEFRKAAACYRESFRPLDGELTPERARALQRFATGARAWLSWTLESLGEFDEALMVGREGVQIAQARGDPLSEMSTSCLLAGVHLTRGEWSQSVPLLERALVLCRSYDIRDWLSPVTMRLGYAYAQSGRLGEGIALLEEGVAHAEAIQGFTGHSPRLAALALTYLLAERRADAEETARQGIALARKQQQAPGEAACLRALGVIASAADPPKRVIAEAYLTQALALAAALGMRPLVAHCHLDFATLYGSIAKSEQAGEHLAIATTMYREMKMQFWLEKADALRLRGAGA